MTTPSTEKVLERADKVLKRQATGQARAIENLARIEARIVENHAELEELVLARIKAKRSIEKIGDDIDNLEIAVSIATEKDLSHLTEHGESEESIREAAIRDIIGQTAFGGLKALSKEAPLATGF